MRRSLALLAALALLAPVAAFAGTLDALYFRATQTNGVAGYDLSATRGSVAPNGTQVSATSVTGATTWRTYYSINTLNANKTIAAGSTWTVELWGYESSNSANNGYRAIVSYRRSTTDTAICTTGSSAELARTNPAVYTLTCTNAGTLNLLSGDRIKIDWQLINVGTGSASYVDYQHFDGNTAGSAGDAHFHAPACLPNITDTCNSTYTETATEAITAAESLASAFTAPNAFSESVSADTSQSGGLAYSEAFLEDSAAPDLADQWTWSIVLGTSEALAIDTSQASTATYAHTHTEALTIAESQASAKTTAAAYAEALTIAESQTGSFTAPNAFSEAITAATSQTGSATYPNAFTEAIGLDATFSSAATYPNTMGEALDLAMTALDTFVHETAPQTYTEAFSEIVSMADSSSTGAVFSSAFSEGIAAADEILQKVLLTHGIEEALAPGETLESRAEYLSAVTETINLLDSATHQAICTDAFTEAVTLGVTAVPLRTPSVFTETITESLNLVCAPAGGGTLERGGTNE